MTLVNPFHGVGEFLKKNGKLFYLLELSLDHPRPTCDMAQTGQNIAYLMGECQTRLLLNVKHFDLTVIFFTLLSSTIAESHFWRCWKLLYNSSLFFSGQFRQANSLAFFLWVETSNHRDRQCSGIGEQNGEVGGCWVS